MRKGGGRGMVEVQERLIECSGVVHVHVKNGASEGATAKNWKSGLQGL